MNKVILIGRVGKDADTKTFQDGNKLSTFSLATSTKWRDKSGEQKERTEWHTIVVNTTRLAEVAEKYVRKGMLLGVDGEIRYRDYTTKEGEKKYVTEIICYAFEMLSKKDDNVAEVAEKPNIKNDDVIEFEDLPFA